MADPGPAGMLRRRMSLLVDHLSKRFGTVVALDDLAFEVPPGRCSGSSARTAPARRRRCGSRSACSSRTAGEVRWRGVESHKLPRSTFGYLPEERGLYPRMRVMEQLVFFAGLQGVPRRGARSARRWPGCAVPRRGPGGPQGRAALEGQPAEGPVHRRGPPRPAGDAHGRAVHRPRPGQRDAPARGVPRAAGPRPDRRVLDPPDGGRGGAVRVGRDRRPRPDGDRRAAARRAPVHGTAAGPDRGGGRPPDAVAGLGARDADHPGRAWSARASSWTRATSPSRCWPPRWPPARGSSISSSPTHPGAGVHRRRGPTAPTRTSTSRTPRHGRGRCVHGARSDRRGAA